MSITINETITQWFLTALYQWHQDNVSASAYSLSMAMSFYNNYKDQL